MEIVQTGTNPWRWCMSMFGARFAVFVRRACVLPTPCPATRNLSFWRFHRHRHTVVSTRCSTGLVRVGVKIPLDGNRANVYSSMALVHEHVCRLVCSVCATGARVAQPVAITIFHFVRLFWIFGESLAPDIRATVGSHNSPGQTKR
jgi:hypothetical protein